MDDNTRSKNLIKGVGIYGIGTFGTKILSFLIVPLYTYYIATADMGIYDLLMSTVQLLTPIITLQISDAAYRWILRDEAHKDIYIRSTIQVLLINCLLAGILILISNNFIKIPYCQYFCLVLILSRIFATLQKLLRAIKNQKLFAISGIVYAVVYLILNVLQVCVLKKGIVSLFQSAIVADIVSIIVIIVVEPGIRINYIKKIDVGIVKTLYKYSIPLVPNYLNWWIINSSDRYIVTFFLGASANGILAVAHKFPTTLQTVLNLFTTSWQDVSIADSEKNTGDYYTKIFKKYYRFALSMLWLLIPLTKIVINYIMSDAYKSACDFVAFYYLGTVFQSFASFYGVGYLKNKNTGKAFSTSVYGAIVNAVVNIAFIKFIGLQAAAVSTFIGFLVMWLVREHQNREELGIKVQWSEFLGLTLGCIAVSMLSNSASVKWNFILLLIGVSVFLVFNKENVITIKKFLKNKVNKKDKN